MKATDMVAQIKSNLLLSSVVKDAVALRGSGTHFVGLCPFHEEKTPSFNVWDSQGTFKCFGCGAFGDVFEFIMKLRGLSFVEAKTELSDRAGLKNLPILRGASTRPQDKKDLLIHAQKVAQEFFVKSLHEKSGDTARAYLQKERGLHEAMIKQAGLGFGGSSLDSFINFLEKNGISVDIALKAGLLKPGSFSPQATFMGRITFPIRSFLGKIIAFGGRSFLSDDVNSPKYVNTHAYIYYEKRRALYGLFESKPALLKGRAPVLVEGYFDALAMWAAGVPAVASCGTSLSVEHVKLLKRLCTKVVLCFDNDQAGLKAMRAALHLLLSNNFTVGAIELQKNDPGEYLSTGDISTLKSLLNAPTDALVVLIEQAALSAQKGVASRIAELSHLLPVLSAIAKPFVRRQYVGHLAKSMNEDPLILWREIDALAKKPAAKISSEPGQPLLVELQARDRVVLQALRLFPELTAEITPEVLQELSPTIREMVVSYMATQEQDFVAFIERAAPLVAEKLEMSSEIPFKFEELQEIIRAIHRQAILNQTKKALEEKRRILHLAQKKNDVDSMLKALAEQSLILARNKPVQAKPLNLQEKNSQGESMPPAVLKVAAPQRRNKNKIEGLTDSLEMLSKEDDWL